MEDSECPPAPSSALIFPEITSSAQMDEALRQAPRKDFVKLCKDDIIVYDYQDASHSTFPTINDTTPADKKQAWLLLREARGLIFSSAGEVLSRRYHKFFNINERPDTALQLIDMTRPHVILEKLDGSLIGPICTGGVVRWATKRGITALSATVEAFCEQYRRQHSAPPTQPPPFNSAFGIQPCSGDKRCDYSFFSAALLAAGWTPIFEFIGPSNPLVTPYPADALILTGVRHNRRGCYLGYSDQVAVAAHYGIPCVRPISVFHDGAIQDMEALVDIVRRTPDVEGFVLRFETGEMYKIKTSWYLQKVQGKAGLNSEFQIWRCFLEDTLDDALSFVAPARRAQVQAFVEASWRRVSEFSEGMVRQIEAARSLAREDHYARLPNADSEIQKLVCDALFAEVQADPNRSLLTEGRYLDIVKKTLLRGLRNVKGFFPQLQEFSGNVELPPPPPSLHHAQPREKKAKPAVAPSAPRSRPGKEESLEDIFRAIQLDEIHIPPPDPSSEKTKKGRKRH